jgi:hypothetical protein
VPQTKPTPKPINRPNQTEQSRLIEASTCHFTPTSASWLNAVEGFFSTITRRKIRRGVFTSVADLEGAISRYIKAHNKTSKPFEWTASAPAIFKKLAQTPEPSE